MSRLTFNSDSLTLRALGQLSSSSKSLNDSFTRLSSGLRINKASDDAAGLAIADTLKIDTRITNQAIKNISDGISLYNIAESAIDSLSMVTERMIELATQASNATLGKAQRLALDLEAQTLSKEFTRIRNSTQFNGNNLLSGLADKISIQAGVGKISSILGDVGGGVGTGEFGAAKQLGVSTTFSGILTADFNGDGYSDLAYSNKGAGGSVLLGDGNGNFSSSQFGAIRTEGLQIGDFNGDGVLDFVYQGPSSALTISLGNGDGTFKAQSTYSATNSIYFETGDVNGNGTSDIVHLTGTGMSLHTTDSNGRITSSSVIESGGGTLRFAALKDFNGDNILDIAYVGASAGQLSVKLGVGDGTFGSAVNFSTPAEQGIKSADLNGDGIADLVTSNTNTNAIFLGNGDGSFKAAVTYTNTPPGIGGMAIQDFNGDGIPDIHHGGNLLFGNGDGSFRATISTGDGVNAIQAFGDFNNDGILDGISYGFSELGLKTGIGISGVSSISTFSLTSLSDARQALPMLKRRSEQLSRQKGSLGAFQGRLSHALSNAQISSLQYREAESQIRDVDVATESAQLVKTLILQKAATSVLSSISKQPDIALRLLRTD